MTLKTNAVFGIYYGLAPDKDTGPKVLNYVFDFPSNTAAAVLTDDFVLESENGQLPFIQGVYIDNRLGAKPFALTMLTTGQVVQVPANSQAIMPAFAINGSKFSGQQIGAVDADRIQITVLFVNVPVPAMVWKAT